MIHRRVFSFLKNVSLFLIDRLYKEWVYMCGNGQSYSEESSERGDLYAKPLIEKIIHDRGRKYDKYMVDGIFVISYGAISVVMGEAHLTGLSTLHRSNICLTEVGKRVFITGTFRAGPLAYQRGIVFKFGDFQRKTSVLVSLMDIKVSVDFSIEKETGRNGFLLNFAVNELKGFKLRVNGLGYFDWTINLVLSFFTLVLGRMVRNLLENELEQYILRRLPNYQFPVEGTSYRNETKFNTSSKDVHKNEASLSETSCMKQRCEMPKLSRVSPIDKKSMCDVGKGHNSIEYGTVKEFGYNLETKKTCNSFLQTDNRTTEVNSFCMPEQSLGLCSESECENSCTEVSKDKSEDNCVLFSTLSSDSISNLKNSSPQGITSKNRLEDACPLSDWNIPNELNDISETESIRENTAPVTSSPAKGFGLKGAKKVLFSYESSENAEKSQMEDSSQTLRDSCGDLVEMASEDLKENTGHSERVDDIFSKIHEHFCRKNVDENALVARIKLPTSVANYDSSPSTKMELSHIDVNILKPEAGTFFDPALNRAPEMLIEEISDERNGRTEDLNKNQQVSIESSTHYQSLEVDSSVPNLDLKFCNAQMFQNDILNTCKDDGVAGPENETQIQDSESIKSHLTEILLRNQGVEMPETRCISYPDDRADGQTLLKSDILSDSMEPVVIQDENFDSGTATTMISTSPQFSERHEDEVNEKIALKYAEGYIGEDALNEDSLNIADEGCTSNSPRNSEELNASNFQNEDTKRKNPLEKLKGFLNECDNKCPNCTVEFSSVAGLKSNADSLINCLETPDRKALHDFQMEIIAKTHKLKSDVLLESESEDNAYPGSFPVSSYNDLENETEGLGHNEVNRLMQKDSKRNDFEVSSLLEGDVSNSSISESSTESDIEMTKLAASKINVSNMKL